MNGKHPNGIITYTAAAAGDLIESANRASIRASLTSFFVFDSVIILRRQGFAA